MAEPIGKEPARGREFYPNDNAQDLGSVDWKSRYNELKNRKDWDPETQFIGLKRLGDRYHPLDVFFKFDGVAKESQAFDNLWIPGFTTVVGFVSSVVSNFWSARPLVSSFPRHLGFGLLGLGVGLYARHNQQTRAAQRDAVLIHYLLLHENEFPMIGMNF